MLTLHLIFYIGLIREKIIWELKLNNKFERFKMMKQNREKKNINAEENRRIESKENRRIESKKK